MALAKKDEQTPLVSGGTHGAKPIVKMTRETPMHKGGPVTADVHADEVDAWTKAGWTVAKE